MSAVQHCMEPAPAPRSERAAGIRVVLGAVGLMWALEIVDLLSGHALDAYGIIPRDEAGLGGILTAPLLHFGFGHLAGNTVPLAVLGLVIALGGLMRVAVVSVVVAVVSGAGIWLFAPGGSLTLGASGLVFGFAAYLIARGAFARSLPQLALGAVVVAVFGTGLLAGLVPQPGVSWQGHLFGALGGVLAARLVHARRAPRANPGMG